MIDFNISSTIDQAVQDIADYSATYVIRVGGEEVYRASLCRRQNTVRSSRFETSVAGFLPFEINQTSQVGLRKIDVREAFAGVRIGEIRGPKLYFDGPNQIVGLHDPAPLLQRVLRQTLRGCPACFVFRRAIDRSAIGWIGVSPSAPNPWPIGIFRDLKRSLREKESLVWQGQVTASDLDLRPFVAAAVVLHSDCGYGGGSRGLQGPPP